ncbi:transcriptional regulator, TetR family [Monaibacterium marinum]|uniref:Transcriptional regulator, TetR family n=1 Tax=Pontivivens marinum TaxID=1690039 RepID=A0A2C9CMC4_9RHOB|nr:TetR family transcriptional regulator [Monaibacterium marinum]SOH92388.1 transcriptional regulator, TetR family [Monaibacterium marinum]
MRDLSTSYTTREALLTHGLRLFWSRGFTNVSVREVARAAGVDVALISRYYGSKLGLFEATLHEAYGLDGVVMPDGAALVDAIVQVFVTLDRGSDMPSVTRLIQMNADDEQVGHLVRKVYDELWQSKIEGVLGDPSRAALMSSAILGLCVAENSLKLDGFAAPHLPHYEQQVRFLLTAALNFEA